MNNEDPSLYLDQDYPSTPNYDACGVPSASSRVSDYVMIHVLDYLQSLSKPDSCASQNHNCVSTTQIPDSALPPRYSIGQPPFSRTREIGSIVYPSACYAIPECSCMLPTYSPYKMNPINFIGVDIVEFDENDPATLLRTFPSIVVAIIRIH